MRINDTALVEAAIMSDRYIADRFLPDKAIDLIDEAAAKLKMEITSKPLHLDEIDRKVCCHPLTACCCTSMTFTESWQFGTGAYAACLLMISLRIGSAACAAPYLKQISAAAAAATAAFASSHLLL